MIGIKCWKPQPARGVSPKRFTVPSLPCLGSGPKQLRHGPKSGSGHCLRRDPHQMGHPLLPTIYHDSPKKTWISYIYINSSTEKFMNQIANLHQRNFFVIHIIPSSYY